MQPNQEVAGDPNHENGDVGVVRVCTIMLKCMMTLLLKGLAMVTFGMVTLISESAVLMDPKTVPASSKHPQCPSE